MKAEKEDDIFGSPVEAEIKQPTVTTTVKKSKRGKGGGTTKNETKVEKVGDPKLFKSAHCTVGVSAKMTRNLGNYESVQLGIDIHVPCLHTEIDATYAFALKWVDDNLSEQLKQLEGEDGGDPLDAI